jgi:hypothetical protein
MFHQSPREIPGQEKDTGPHLMDVRPAAEFLDASQLVQRVVEPPVGRRAAGRRQMLLAPSLDGGQQGQVRPAAAARQARRILGATNGTAKGHALVIRHRRRGVTWRRLFIPASNFSSQPNQADHFTDSVGISRQNR